MAINQRTKRWLPIVLLIGLTVTGGTYLKRGASAESATSSDSDDVKELEEVTNDVPAKSANGGAATQADQDSLNDLEKVIETEDAKGPAAPPAQASASSKRQAVRPVGPPAEAPSVTPVEEPAVTPERQRSAAAPPPAPQAEAIAPAPEEKPKRSTAEVEASHASVRNAITNLEFKLDGASSRIVVTSRNPLHYREVRNLANRQIIYYFDNTETPERLQRLYDTTEFPSAVALFTLLQMPKERPPTSKLIVELREDKFPTILSSSHGLYIDFPPPSRGIAEAQPTLTPGNRDSASRGQASEDNPYLDSQTYTGRTIRRLNIKNSDVQDVLRLIGRTSGMNIVIGDDVQGKVGTLSLENIPWDQAFALVLQSKKLGYVRQGNVIRVATLQTLKAEKDEALATEQAKIKVEPLRTVIIPISYAKASELAPQAKGFLTERGTLQTDSRTNTIIVKDIDRVVSRVQKLFTALDTQPPRVAISAKIVEMQSNFTRNIGSQLNFNTNTSGLNFSQTTGFGAGGAATTVINAPNFGALQATFDLLENEEKIKILANPSVSVVANQQATVSQSLSFFVPANEVAGGQLVASSRQVTTSLTLNVTPIVAGDGSIFMTVSVKNEIPHLNSTNTTIDSRQVNTQILLENGDTAVIGGVFSNTVNTQQQGIPLLMRIPIIGQLFRQDMLNDARNEIFIFLTAKITNVDESFKRSF